MVSNIFKKEGRSSGTENVKQLTCDDAKKHIGGLTVRLNQLSTILVAEGDSYVSPYISLMMGSLNCLRAKHSIEGDDRLDFDYIIDPTDSGFPTVTTLFMLERDKKNAADVLRELASRERIIESVRDRILKSGSPVSAQIQLRRFEFFESLNETEILRDYHKGKPEFVREEKGQRFYTLEWLCIERGTNVPVFYRMCLTQDSNESPLHEQDNSALDLLIYGTQRGMLDLRTFISTVDREFRCLHPKIIDKFVIGPYYDEFTHNSPELERALHDSEDKRVLKFSRESVATLGTKRHTTQLAYRFSEVANRFGDNVSRATVYLAEMMGQVFHKEIYGSLDNSDRRMIVSFRAKQNIVKGDEHGKHCKIYGITNDGGIIS